MKKLKQKIKNEKGQAIVEFAIILPLILLIVFAIIDFSWIAVNQIKLTNATAEGARYFARHTELYDGQIERNERNEHIKTYIVDNFFGIDFLGTQRTIEHDGQEHDAIEIDSVGPGSTNILEQGTVVVKISIRLPTLTRFILRDVVIYSQAAMAAEYAPGEY